MKKIFIILGVILLLTGCGKYNDKNLVKDVGKKVNNAKSYHLIGTLDIYRNEEKYSYDVDSSYKKEDLFKVNLRNNSNDHEQIILKNKEGVYVITPSLNKNFKFQSDWPYNNSQIYLLQPIITDISNEKDREFKTTKNGYVITSKVDYPTEKDYVKQKVYIDNDKNITRIEVLDKEDNIKMKLKISNIEYNSKFDDDYFEAKTYQKDVIKKDKETSKLDEVVYPMYVPEDTYLTAQDVVEIEFSIIDSELKLDNFEYKEEFSMEEENISFFLPNVQNNVVVAEYIPITEKEAKSIEEFLLSLEGITNESNKESAENCSDSGGDTPSAGHRCVLLH